MPRRAFTLIELLVVIAIIALLTSILLPSLSRSRAIVKSVKCRTQLRDLGLAFLMYVQDQHELIPLNTYINYQTYDDGGLRGRDYPWPVLLTPYQGEQRNIHLCPSMPRDLYPQAELQLDNAWDYFETMGLGSIPVYPTSYQMKPDLGSTEFIPRLRKRDLWSRFVYETQPLTNEFGHIYPIVTRFNQIPCTGRVMLFSDRWHWHTEPQGSKDFRQVVMCDGSASDAIDAAQDFMPDTRYIKEYYWFRTLENMPAEMPGSP